MKRVAIAVSSVVALWIAACGGRVTSVDDNKKVGSLSPTDTNMLCSDTYNYFRMQFAPDDLAKLSCGFRNQGSPTCKADYDKCVADITPKIGTPSTPNCTGFDQLLAKCGNVSVGQWVTCYKQAIDVMKSSVGSFPLCTQEQVQQWGLNAAGKISQECLGLWIGCSASFNIGVGGGTPPPK